MIRIECKGADSLPIDAIEEFQGNLKKRGKKEIEQIITSIEKYGFSFPFFIWNGTGHNYCLDGHGRLQALVEMRRRGEDLPLFPVAYIEAKDEAEAKQKLLRINSQYGQMSIESIADFMGDIEINGEELSFHGIDLVIEDGEIKKPEVINILPYNKIHILISISPNDFPKILKHIDEIRKTSGVEYEQSAN